MLKFDSFLHESTRPPMPILEAPGPPVTRSEARLPGEGGHGGPHAEDRGTGQTPWGGVWRDHSPHTLSLGLSLCGWVGTQGASEVGQQNWWLPGFLGSSKRPLPQIPGSLSSGPPLPFLPLSPVSPTASSHLLASNAQETWSGDLVHLMGWKPVTAQMLTD